MRPKDHYHSLDHRGAFGRFIITNYWGDGETTLVTETGKIVKRLNPAPLDKNVYRMQQPAPSKLRSKVLTSPYRSLTLPDSTDAWQRVDDGFVFEHTPFECVPRDIESPAERTGNWEKKVNEYDALDTFEPTDDVNDIVNLVVPPLFDHQDPEIEETNVTTKKKTRFADQFDSIIGGI
eukprot:377957-Amphidinium_carterae.2